MSEVKEVRVQYEFDLLNKNGEVEKISGYSKLELFLEGIAEHSRKGAIINFKYNIEYVKE